MNCTPEFYFVVPDNSLLDIGIQKGDSIFCDRNPGPAYYVVGVWDDLVHVCVGNPRLYEINGIFKTSSEWATIAGISRKRFNKRWAAGKRGAALLAPIPKQH